MKPSPRFRLFRLTQPLANGCAYAGHLTAPDGRVYLIEARVVEEQGFRSFAGEVSRADARALFRGAKLKGTLPKEVQDLVDQAEGLPFDDAEKLGAL